MPPLGAISSNHIPNKYLSPYKRGEFTGYKLGSAIPTRITLGVTIATAKRIMVVHGVDYCLGNVSLDRKYHRVLCLRLCRVLRVLLYLEV
jgi:hypothetical protein